MSASSQRRILIVEDESLIALDLAELVNEFGYEVCAVARSADEAFVAAREHHPDLILADIRLADGASGVDAARRIREQLGIRSFFISGSIESELIEEARSIAPYGFLSKPVQTDMLKAMLAKAFGGDRL